MNTPPARMPGIERAPLTVDDLPEPVRRLAVVLSVATRVEPELLRAARVELRPTLDVGAESGLWFGDWATRTGSEYVTLRPELLAPLRAELAEEMAASHPGDPVRRTGGLLARAHGSLSPVLAVEEGVTWAAVVADARIDPPDPDSRPGRIDGLLQRVLRTALEEPDRRDGLGRWFAGAWKRMPERVTRTAAARELAALLLYGEDSTSGPLRLPHQSPTDVVLAVRHDGAELTFGDPTWPADGILVPDTDVRTLDISARRGDWSAGTVVEVPREGVVRIPVTHVPVFLRTARGHVYAVGAPGLGGTTRVGSPGTAAVWEAPAEPPPAAPQPATGKTAGSAQGRPPFAVPTPGPGSVYRGAAALDRILRAIEGPDARGRAHVLAGLGGVGKSRMAMEIAARFEGRRQVWWMSAAGVEAGMRTVAAQMGLSRRFLARANMAGPAAVADLIWRELGELSAPWLLVVDRADVPKDVLGDSGGVRWVRAPVTPHGLVLVTSRYVTPWAPAGFHVHMLQPLAPQDGAALLMDLAPHAGTRDEATELARELGGLPLALRQAGDFLAMGLTGRVRDGFAKYAATVRASVRTNTGPEGVPGLKLAGPLCERSLDLLARSDQSEAELLLRVLALFGDAPVPRDLLTPEPFAASPLFPTGMSPARLRAALDNLAGHSLVESVRSRPFAVADGPLPDRDRARMQFLHMHPLLRALLRSDSASEQDRSEYDELTVDLLEHATRKLPPESPVSWPMWNALSPHVEHVARNLTGTQSRTAVRALALARRTVEYHLTTGQPHRALPLAEALMSSTVARSLRRDSEAKLRLRFQWARARAEMGDLTLARKELEMVTALWARRFGADEPETLAVRHFQADLLVRCGAAAEALPMLAEILEGQTVHFGREEPAVIATWHSLLTARMAVEGDTAETEIVLRPLLDRSVRYIGRSAPETLRLRLTLARLLLSAGRDHEVLREVTAATHGCELRPDAPVLMALRFTRSEALAHLGDLTGAAKELRSLVPDCTRVLGPDHPDTVMTRDHLQALLNATRDD